MIIIKVDYREKSLIKKLKLLKEDFEYQNIEIIVENLPLGDVTISKKHNAKTRELGSNKEIEELIIFERKTLNDLASSIKDGRYAEQSYRLDKINHPNHNIVYIIEGDVQFWGNRYTNIKPQTLYVTMFCINFFKGFSVFKSKNERETAEYLLRISNKLNRETKKCGYYIRKNTKVKDLDEKSNTTDVINSIDTDNKDTYNKDTDININRKSYVDVKSRVKKDHITPDNIGEIILSQIPGVSAFISKVIMSHFESLHDLLNKLKEDPSCLDNIKYKLKSGQERRITKKSIVNIVKYLLYQKDTTIVVNTE